jgi:hypothetical protein
MLLLLDMKLALVSIPLHSPCPRCRKQVLPQAAFCPRCGVRLRTAQYSAPSASPIVATPFRPQIPVIGSPKTLEYATPRPKETRKRVSNSKSGTGRFVAVAAIFMAVRFITSTGNQNSTSSPPITRVPPMPRFVPPPQISVPRLSPPAVYTPTPPAPTNPRTDPRNRDGRWRSADDPRNRASPSEPRGYIYPSPRTPAR